MSHKQCYVKRQVLEAEVAALKAEIETLERRVTKYVDASRDWIEKFHRAEKETLVLRARVEGSMPAQAKEAWDALEARAEKAEAKKEMAHLADMGCQAEVSLTRKVEAAESALAASQAKECPHIHLIGDETDPDILALQAEVAKLVEALSESESIKDFWIHEAKVLGAVIAEMREAAKNAAPAVCSLLCESVKLSTPMRDWKHEPECIAIEKAALTPSSVTKLRDDDEFNDCGADCYCRRKDQGKLRDAEKAVVAAADAITDADGYVEEYIPMSDEDNAYNARVGKLTDALGAAVKRLREIKRAEEKR